MAYPAHWDYMSGFPGPSHGHHGHHGPPGPNPWMNNWMGFPWAAQGTHPFAPRGHGPRGHHGPRPDVFFDRFAENLSTSDDENVDTAGETSGDGAKGVRGGRGGRGRRGGMRGMGAGRRHGRHGRHAHQEPVDLTSGTEDEEMTPVASEDEEATIQPEQITATDDENMCDITNKMGRMGPGGRGRGGRGGRRGAMGAGRGMAGGRGGRGGAGKFGGHGPFHVNVEGCNAGPKNGQHGPRARQMQAQRQQWMNAMAAHGLGPFGPMGAPFMVGGMGMGPRDGFHGGWGGPCGGPHGFGPHGGRGHHHGPGARGMSDRENQPKQQNQGKKGGRKWPVVDVFDGAEAYEVHASLPGAKRSDVEVSWDAETSKLLISGTISRPGDEEFLNTMTKDERRIGDFERRVRLGSRDTPAQIVPEGITARLQDGILKIEVPKVDADVVEVGKGDIEE